MPLILGEVIMLDGHMPDGQMYSFLQIFLNTEKNQVNLKIEYHCNKLRVAYIHCDTTLINIEPLKNFMSIRYKIQKKKKKNHAA